LHIDEMQSDLHTQGSKQGYRLPDAEFNRIKQEIDPLLEGTSFAFRRHAADGQPGLAFAREGDIDGFLDFQTFDMYASRSPEKRKEMFILDPNYDVNKYKYDGNRGKQLLAELGGDREKFNKFVDTIKPLISEGKVPNYPFKDDWHNMTLKNMVLQAIEEGKDSVSVSTSYAMKTRYSDKYDSFYETLYDKKIPSAMKKLANKYGGKFEKGKLDFDDTFEISINPPDEDALDTNILRITPEMKQKILEEGMPSFAYGGPVNKFIGPNDINVFSD
jgi:hypothetical protein